ncbi:hypothetical protein Tco_1139696, partial [Tanacetum coccineum]
MFDEFFNPPPSVVSLLHAAAARRHADLTGSPIENTHLMIPVMKHFMKIMFLK